MNIIEALQQAAHLYRARQYRDAVNIYLAILREQPDQHEANHNIGCILMGFGQYAEGLTYLQNAYKYNKSNQQYCLDLASCLLYLDRSSAALDALVHAIQQQGFNSPPILELQRVASRIAEGINPEFLIERKVDSLFGAGHFMELEGLLEQLLSRYPDWGKGWDRYCTVLQIQKKDYENAMQRTLYLMVGKTDGNHTGRKIFCIGANKTGTTSIEHVFKSLGMKVGNQAQAEMFLHDWAKRDFRRIIKYCHTADAFQDMPFSFDDTFRVVDEAFPDSKFILTVRNNAGEWFESLVRFHTAIVGKGHIPTAEDLRCFGYRYPGFILDSFKARYGEDVSQLYNRELYIQWYEKHIDNVKEYFKDRMNDLLILNIGDADAMKRLLLFLGYPYNGQEMPHLNATRD